MQISLSEVGTLYELALEAITNTVEVPLVDELRAYLLWFNGKWHEYTVASPNYPFVILSLGQRCRRSDAMK
jgi:hypothetical protein